MRKLIMTLTALLLLATVSLEAQSRRGGKPAGARAEQRLPLEELDLSAEQQVELKTLREETRAKMKALRAENGAQRPDRAALEEIKASSQQQMLEILTPEQRTKLEALRAERKEAWENVDKTALKSDLKEHREEVKAVLQAARGQLDDFISAEDQVTIERLRGVVATRPKFRKQDRSASGKPTEEERAAARTATQEWRTEHAADLEELKALSEKYAADIERVRERLEPQVKEWKAEKREILERYLPAAKPKRRGNRTQRSGKEPHGAAFLLLKS
ncbi:MAG: hypothetical protein AAFN92_15320 [Bacteroidota bacterium]